MRENEWGEDEWGHPSSPGGVNQDAAAESSPHCRAVMAGERLQLRMHLGVIPVGALHGRLKVVDHQPLRYAAEVGEGVLQTGDERFGPLSLSLFPVVA